MGVGRHDWLRGFVPGGKLNTFGVYGDSHTSYSRPSIEDARDNTNGSWTTFAEAPCLTFTGHWASAGAKTCDALPHVTANHDDVLVVMLGTNDVTQNVATEVTLAHLREIATTSCAKRVLFLANPPRDGGRAASQQSLNSSIQALADESPVWHFYDPWTLQRASNGTWSQARYTTDGLHATRGVYEYMGIEVRPVIESLAVTPEYVAPVTCAQTRMASDLADALAELESLRG